MNAQFTDSTPAGATAGANAQAQLVIAAVTGKRLRLTFLALSYSGAAPAAPLQATVSDGTTTLYFGVGSQQVLMDGCAMMFATGAAITITLPAGGVSVVGNISAAAYADGVN